MFEEKLEALEQIAEQEFRGSLIMGTALITVFFGFLYILYMNDLIVFKH